MVTVTVTDLSNMSAVPSTPGFDPSGLERFLGFRVPQVTVTLAEGPIALCEVQGYAYAAKLAGATIASALGQTKKARVLLTQAEVPEKLFRKPSGARKFRLMLWLFDGKKQQCEGERI